MEINCLCVLKMELQFDNGCPAMWSLLLPFCIIVGHFWPQVWKDFGSFHSAALAIGNNRPGSYGVLIKGGSLLVTVQEKNHTSFTLAYSAS